MKFEVDNRCAPTAEMFVCEVERCYGGMLLQKLVNSFAQLPDAFAVNDSHSQNSPRVALRQIIQHQRLHVARLKGVQVQHSINR